jgi:hypothetical protein
MSNFEVKIEMERLGTAGMRFIEFQQCKTQQLSPVCRQAGKTAIICENLWTTTTAAVADSQNPCLSVISASSVFQKPVTDSQNPC